MMLSTTSLALCLLSASQLAQGVKVQQLFQFPNASQIIENIAIRPNGHLLLDTFDNGRMYTIDPQAKNPEPKIVLQVPGVNALTGIAEIAPDVFAVTGGTLNLTGFDFVEGTGVVNVFNFNRCKGDGTPSVRTVAKAPNVFMLNGLVSLPKHPEIVLSADSVGGRVLRINTITGHVDVAFQDDRFTAGPGPVLVPLGINGLKLHDGYLYLTNSNQLFLARIRINEFGNRAGQLEILAHFTVDPPRVPDDFTLARDGTAYVAAHVASLVKVSPNGKWADVVGADSEVKLDSPTSALLSKDEKTVYVTTFGGTNALGGQLLAVHL